MRVFTIDPSTPFLPTLARAIVEGWVIDGLSASTSPLDLARATLYLPTRRACLAARSAFLDALGRDAALLPRIVALGDIDEDELVFASSGEAPLTLPPAIGATERRLMLAQMVRAFPGAGGEGIAATPLHALMLADDLARLTDDLITRKVPWTALDALVPELVDEHWQQTLEFLKIVRDYWPKVLDERGVIEAAARRDLLIDAEAAALRDRPKGPVIAAGSTASMPATAKLLQTIASLPQGAVILPGLDRGMDASERALLAGTSDDVGAPPTMGHPQHAMQAWLTQIGLDAPRVEMLGLSPRPQRDRLVAEAMRPAASTERWFDAPALSQRDRLAALDGVSVIEAASAEEEALAVALILREAAETLGTRAALVTPDRALARRVAVALERWNIRIPDTAGTTLAATPAGVMAQLVADVVDERMAPVPLLALLKHPLFRLGRADGGWRESIDALERALLRGSRPPPGTRGLREALTDLVAAIARLREGDATALHYSDPRATLTDQALQAAGDLVAALEILFDDAGDGPPTTLAAHAARHRARVLTLAKDAEDNNALDRRAGAALLDLFDDWIATPAAAELTITSADYREIFRASADVAIVRGPFRDDAPIGIFGPLEARLANFDRVVLAGLNEGTWPPEASSDAWLNRPMRSQLGLDLPERRIGLSAHDFVQLMGAADVYLTRATRRGTTPTVASRFMQRLAAVSGREAWDRARSAGTQWLHWARLLDRPERKVPRVRAPAPVPVVALRPTRLSVTQIEDWLRDPYTIFARHILKLRPLDEVDMPLTAAGRGNAIHAALADYVRAPAPSTRADGERHLVALAQHHFAALAEHAEARALWWPRFLRVARWFAGWDLARRLQIESLAIECDGVVDIPVGGERSFRLAARADRIEKFHDGSFAILDYKTGAPPSPRQVTQHLAPQLPLEAAILRRGGFAFAAAGAHVSELSFVSLRGQYEGGEFQPAVLGANADALADDAFAKLTSLVIAFENPEQPYRSLVLAMWTNRYGTYDDLARVREWSATGGAGNDDGGGEA